MAASVRLTAISMVVGDLKDAIASLAIVVLFGLLGPLSASIVILLYWGLGIWLFGLPTPQSGDDYWAVTVIVTFFAYYIGGIPALLTGLGASLLSPYLGATWKWMGAATGLGLLFTAITVSIFAQNEPRGVDSLAGWYLFIGSAIVGSVTGAFATLRLRPRAVE